MAQKKTTKKVGAMAALFLNPFKPDNVIKGSATETVETEPTRWYSIIAKADDSNMTMDAGQIFRSPYHPDNQIVLKDGDILFPIPMTRFCKSSCDMSFETDEVDVTDDCSGGFGEALSSGIVKISGSFGGFASYDPVTQELAAIQSDLFNRFFPTVVDDDKGGYAMIKRTDDVIFAAVLLNNDVKDGQIENWLIFEVTILSVTPGLGNTEGQSQQASWTKGEGVAVLYKCVHHEHPYKAPEPAAA